MVETSQQTDRSDSKKAIQIVGIGASAGGLNALEQFFSHVPMDSGMAFVVIQHLSPDFKSLMDDLLARHTNLPIFRVVNGMEIQADRIYLIPPKTHMTVSGEKLFLTEKSIGVHGELPIDIFFHSLAEDVGSRAVGVVLSGTGSDGSRGILSIKKKGGLVIVQAPESAQFDGMPRSAIATGVCDFMLAPERIPRILVEYAVNPEMVRTKVNGELQVFEEEGEFAAIFALLRKNYNLDFAKYKCSTVGRRIRRRMEFRQISQVSDYAAVAGGDSAELESLYKDLLIGVTEFFRDPLSFEKLEQQVMPGLFANLGPGEDLRIWSAGCATGEEAYSLAILLAEKAAEFNFGGRITVFATDVHRTSLDQASQGLYDGERLVNVSPARLQKFFKKENTSYRVTSELRKMVVFAPHNLLSDPPFTRLDLVCCRNLLIYFQADMQEKVIFHLHFSLKKEGVLFLGASEGLGNFAGDFDTLSSPHKIFRKVQELKPTMHLDAAHWDRFPPKISVGAYQPGPSRTVSLDRQVMSDYDALMRRYVPCGVLVDENYNIIHFFGEVSEYLKKPEGRPEKYLLAMVDGNLNIALCTALKRADTTRQDVTTRNVHVHRQGEEQLINLTVSPLGSDKNRTPHFHICFEPCRIPKSPTPLEKQEESSPSDFDAGRQYYQHVIDLQTELQSTRESLQTAIEELQASNEELQATNEELLASNEELQSTNEELHSVNEELYSVNSEFERKNLELKQLNTDHDNLLASIDIGTIFLDRKLRIRKYNPAILSFFSLLPQDIGRPIDHIAYQVSPQKDVLADIHQVLALGNPVEKEEKTSTGRWLLNRIMPFRTETGQIEGAVITLTDITRVKEAEQKLLLLNESLEGTVQERTTELKKEATERRRAEALLGESREYYLNILKSAPALIWRANPDALCDWFNDTWLEFTGRTAEQEYGDGWTAGVHPDDLDRCVRTWHKAFQHRERFEMEYRLRRQDGQYRWILDLGRPMEALDGSFAGYIGFCFDVTDRKQMEEALRRSEEQLQWKLETILSPEMELSEEEIVGMIDFKAVQLLMDDFQKLTRTVFAILDLKGNVLLASGWQEICTAFHRANPLSARHCTESDLFLSHQIKQGEYVPYRCKNGLWDVVTPLFVAGKHIANIYTGQFFREGEAVDTATFIDQAERYGFDCEAYLKALDQVPRMNQERIDSLMNYLVRFADLVSRLTVGNIKLAKALAERQRMEASLKETHDYLDNLLTYANAPVIVWNPQFRITRFNRAAETLTGRKAEEAIGSTVDLLFPPTARSEALRLVERTASGERWETVEIPVSRKDGTVRNVLWNSATITGPDGQTIVATIAQGQDITERKHAEEQLRQSLKMESIGRLAGGVAHDFNNMLALILGYAELAQLEIDKGSGVQEHLNEIVKAAEHSRDITGQLLAFSRQQIIAPRAMDLKRALQEKQNTLPRLIGEEIRLHYELEDGLWPVKIDPTQFDQIVLNLAINARDAMPNGGSLIISAANAAVGTNYCRDHLDARPGDYVRVTFRDTGHGMDGETLRHIFEPFFTTKEVGKGTGLGLATLYGIVTQNRGFIHVESEPHQGACFQVFLPRLMEEAVAEATEAGHPVVGSGTILLVEDDGAVRRLTVSMLRRLGYGVIEAETPQEALTICTEGRVPVDLVLSDVIMPTMNGKELLDRIRTVRPAIRALFMSGYTSEIISQKGLEDGGLHFIPKPFTLHHLSTKLHEVMTRSTEGGE